jgi:hypothetical protein
VSVAILLGLWLRGTSPGNGDGILGETSPFATSLTSLLLTEAREDDGFSGEGTTGAYEDLRFRLSTDESLSSWVELEPVREEVEVPSWVAPGKEISDLIPADLLSTTMEEGDLPACVSPTSSVFGLLLDPGAAFLDFFKGAIILAGPNSKCKLYCERSNCGLHHFVYPNQPRSSKGARQGQFGSGKIETLQRSRLR